MAKGIKTGGRQSVDGEVRNKNIKVRESVKPDVERFRDLLDDPDICDTALRFLEELEKIKQYAKLNNEQNHFDI